MECLASKKMTRESMWYILRIMNMALCTLRQCMLCQCVLCQCTLPSVHVLPARVDSLCRGADSDHQFSSLLITFWLTLISLFIRYLEPLKEETFLSSDEVVRLVGNIQEIVHFQKEFLKNLEESIDDESFVLYTSGFEFKVSLLLFCGCCIKAVPEPIVSARCECGGSDISSVYSPLTHPD